jgi:hypothetical protein
MTGWKTRPSVLLHVGGSGHRARRVGRCWEGRIVDTHQGRGGTRSFASGPFLFRMFIMKPYCSERPSACNVPRALQIFAGILKGVVFGIGLSFLMSIWGMPLDLGPSSSCGPQARRCFCFASVLESA